MNNLRITRLMRRASNRTLTGFCGCAYILTSSLPGNDQIAYYSDTDDEIDEGSGPSTQSNRGNKLYRKNGTRWYRRGKLGHWTEARTERELAGRYRTRVNSFQHANVESLLDTEATMSGGLGGPYRQKRRRMLPSRATHHEYQDISRGDKISLHASTLAPTLLLPVLSARGLLESQTLKHNFRNPHITALSRTAQDLKTSENMMSRSMGRCFASMERIFRVDDSTITHPKYSEDVNAEAEPSQSQYPSSERVQESQQSQEIQADNALPNGFSEKRPDGTGSRIPFLGVDTDGTPPLSQIDKLFITPQGLTLPVYDGNDGSSDRAGAEVHSVTFSAAEQREAVYAGLEALNDLYLDSREYMDRLEDIRLMLADVRRNRSAVWDILRLWALQRDQDDLRASGYYHGAQENDNAEKSHHQHAQESLPSNNRSRKRNGRH